MKKLFWVMLSLFMSTVAIASEKSLYNFSWLDNDKEIYVLQNRKYRKDGSLYIGATAAYNLSQNFLDAYGGTFRGGYFFTEEWGIELLFGKNSNSENDASKGIKETGANPFYRQIESFAGGMVVWSPFYSKINTFNKIFYFDWIFGLGVGSINTKDNRKNFSKTDPDREQLTAENHTGGIWNTGVRLYINQSWSFRLDLTGVVYKAEKFRKLDGAEESFNSSKIYNNYDLGLGLNYAF